MDKHPSFEEFYQNIKNIEQFVAKLEKSERMLRRHTEFERLIAEISSELSGISGRDVDASIVCALGFVGAFIGVDRACLIQLDTDDATVDFTHEWRADGVSSGLDHLDSFQVDKELPYFYEYIRRHDVVQISSVDALPPEAHRERIFFESRGVQALLVIPMETVGKLEGFLCFNTSRNPKEWSEEDQHLLRFLGGTISLVLERKAAESERERLIFELEAALADVKTLSGLLPICSFCKKIRDDKGYWNQLEAYIQQHSDALFSHGICEECMVKHYSDLMA
jgi:transcriptional regulator with GAF, ATPase, and Fis domain